MKNNRLTKWLPCQSYCQMNGAAAAVLSFKNANVVFNGPRWCSVIAERELMTYDRNIEEIGDVDDDFQHAGIAARFEGIADKVDIQLHRIDRHRGDHMQGRIAGTEVIHLDLETEAS